MSFNNPIFGGSGELILDQIKSPDFISGVSGWQLGRDGTAELNDLIARGEVRVGPDTGFQIVVVSQSNTGRIQIWTHAASEGAPGEIVGFVGNTGLANEWMGIQLKSPRHPTPGIADDHIEINLNSQNADNTSRANMNIRRIDASGGPSAQIIVADENTVTIHPNLQIDGELNGWANWVPGLVSGGGTATFSTAAGWYKNLGELYYVWGHLVVGTAGSGGSTLIFTLPIEPYRAGGIARQIMDVHYETAAANLLTGDAVILAGGSGAQVDRMRIQNAGATDVVVNMVGSNLSSGSILTYQGFIRSI